MNSNKPAFPRAAFAPEGVNYQDCEIHDSQEGMTLREYFAAKALQALVSASYGENGYIPGYGDDDFVADEKSSWHKTKYGWICGDAPEDAKLFRLVGTMEGRFARDAVAYADALIAELDKARAK